MHACRMHAYIYMYSNSSLSFYFIDLYIKYYIKLRLEEQY